jgi:hypothetical protein
MPYDFNIYHSQVTPSIPDYDTISLTLTSDLENYATKSYVDGYGDDKYLSLLGGTLSGDLILANQGGLAKNLVLKSANGIPIAVRAGITFTNALSSETGIIVPGLLITDGRLDITPDPTFNRAEFRIKGANSQFNIFNINTFEFYMRVNPDTSVMFGRNTVALSAGAIAMGVSTSAINTGAHSEGGLTLAQGFYSHAEGARTKASSYACHAAGFRSNAAHGYTYAWSDGNQGTSTVDISTTRVGQYMVSASGGMFIPGRVGIGTDSIANALTVAGVISATNQVFSSGAPVVVSTPSFETPTTSISSINNIVALSQATYNALTVKLPTTLYIIV